jgi:uncharacterized membrane protein YedE/YeeE
MKYALALLTLLPAQAFALQPAHFPEINIRTIVMYVVTLVFIAVVLGLLDYWVQKAPFIADPVKAFIHWGLIGVAVLILIYIILGFLGI